MFGGFWILKRAILFAFGDIEEYSNIDFGPSYPWHLTHKTPFIYWISTAASQKQEPRFYCRGSFNGNNGMNKDFMAVNRDRLEEYLSNVYTGMNI